MIDRSTLDGVTTLRMRRDPANVLDLEFSAAIENALRVEITAPDTRGLVITGTEGVFSAGVDLFRLLEDTDEYLTDFLTGLTSLFALAKTYPKPLVAAINGHAIAGGAILALSCDYRIMAEGPAKIGLPELKVGVPFPSSAIDIVRAVVPPHHLREVVLLGRNFDVPAAHSRGLVDEVVPPESVLDRSIEVAAALARVPARAFDLTKQLLSRPSGADTAALDAEVGAVWADDETQGHIKAFLDKTLGKAAR